MNLAENAGNQGGSGSQNPAESTNTVAEPWRLGGPFPPQETVEPAAQATAASSCSYPKVLTSPWTKCSPTRGARLASLPSVASANPLDLAVVVADELNVAHEAPQILPAGEGTRVNDDALQPAVRFNPRVCGERQSIEVLHVERVFDLDHEDALLRQETMGDAALPWERAKPLDGLVPIHVREHPHGARQEEAGNPRDSRIQSQSVTTAQAAKVRSSEDRASHPPMRRPA